MGVGWGLWPALGLERLVGYRASTRNVYSLATPIQMDRILATGDTTGGNSSRGNHSDNQPKRTTRKLGPATLCLVLGHTESFSFHGIMALFFNCHVPVNL